ncbi:MAG: hypothetical protein ABS69_13605 [Nitrosomonadales bacterium SCN 54-20]|nr:MAG: hypothetical protein ABS69_13605 [Nitrosomonadales bacterium SCN 54-20]
MPSVINSDLGPLLLPTNQLATKLLSLHVSDAVYLINSRHGFSRLGYSWLYWNKFVSLFVIRHISPSPIDKMHFVQMTITSCDIALCMQRPDGRDGIRIKLRHAKLNDDLFGKTLTLFRSPDVLPLKGAIWNQSSSFFKRRAEVKKRFTDEQIIGFLKQADGGIQSENYAVNMAFPMPRSTPGPKFGGIPVSDTNASI